MSDYPIFPKVGYHLKFNSDFTLADYSAIQAGTVAEVVAQSIEPENGEYHKHFLYIGLPNKRIVKFNYTVNHYRVDLIPNTPAAQILYG